MSDAQALRVLQFCHGYDGPFLDCARQYAVLFAGSEYKVTTVYLTGAPHQEVVSGSASDEVLFLGYDSADIRGLKLGAIRSIRKIVTGRNFAFCIAHRFKPIYISLLGTQLPVIGVHHAFGDYRRLSRRLLVNLFKKRLSLLGVSNAVRDDIRTCLPSWEIERIATLYNRVDIATLQAEQLDRAAARNALQVPEDAWVIGNVGRLHPDKDQATLIRAYARALPDLPPTSLLLIMGGGKLEGDLKQLAESLGVTDRVRFLGQVPCGRNYFKAFDLFALSSDHEPFGMVLLEAMAAGVPVICSDCGGGREVVAGVGGLFPLGDTDQLASLLRESAHITLQERDKMADRMQKKLTAMFSDTVARPVFFDFVQRHLSS